MKQVWHVEVMINISGLLMVGDEGGSLFWIILDALVHYLSLFLHSNDIPKICKFMLDKTRI